MLTNVHVGFEVIRTAGSDNPEKTYLISGSYEYYHYLCDGFDDRGWGCGYRTLQTICSWINLSTDKQCNVPTIPRIQSILVDMEDKPPSFVGSKQWIGSFEVCLVIEKLYDIPCKIIHVNKGKDLNTIVDTLRQHFEEYGSPAMMGGDMDCSSKGILGICISDADTFLLILDPHYVGKEQSKDLVQKKGWVKWQPLSDFLSNSFYNICLPQVKPIK